MLNKMDLRRNGYLILLVVILLGGEVGVLGGNLVFNVKHKFGGRGSGGNVLKELKAHDARRHGRILAAQDFQLGGNDKATGAALYFTKLAIGTPSKDYHVQVDTGSDLLWINCASCIRCPTESKLGIKMVKYDLQASTTGKTVTCEQDFCAATYDGVSPDCKVGMPCEFSVKYADGSTAGGSFVKDNIYLDQVSGDFKTSPMQGNISFGCSSKTLDSSSSTISVDGIIGFGEKNMSVISQLAAAGTVKKIFSHCLDGNKGGGIFAIGQVVDPKINSVPLLPDRSHYTVEVKDIKVGGEVLNIPTSLFHKSSNAAIIDSGTTLAYLPSKAYNALMDKLMTKQPQLKTYQKEGGLDCFRYSGNVDDGFPTVTFNFVGSLSLTAYPHDYLFQHDKDWCIGWMELVSNSKDDEDDFLIGDILLSNKLVLYDLENQTIGWTQYDCSSSIKVKDEASGNVYTVGSHDISSASTFVLRMAFTVYLSILTYALCYLTM